MSILTKFIEETQTIKDRIVTRWLKDEYICSRESDQVRKYAFVMKKQGLPIFSMKCDCLYKYKHKMYYYDWAMDHRHIKEKINVS
jgi:hypothetical protein